MGYYDPGFDFDGDGKLNDEELTEAQDYEMSLWMDEEIKHRPTHKKEAEDWYQFVDRCYEEINNAGSAQEKKKKTMFLWVTTIVVVAVCALIILLVLIVMGALI